MKKFLPILLALQGAFALSDGELRFTIGGKSYATLNAVAMLQKMSEKKRIVIAVKDIEQRFFLMLTADVADGDELKPLRLNTMDDALAVTLRTEQGVFAVLPHIQLAKPNADNYIERVEVDSGQWEEVPGDKEATDRDRPGQPKQRRRKIKVEYRQVKPRWHQLTREERVRTGEGVIKNSAFEDTYFTLTLTPIIASGKVVAYQGAFSGTGRFSRSIRGAEIRQIQNGAFQVRVAHAP